MKSEKQMLREGLVGRGFDRRFERGQAASACRTSAGLAGADQGRDGGDPPPAGAGFPVLWRPVKVLLAGGLSLGLSSLSIWGVAVRRLGVKANQRTKGPADMIPGYGYQVYQAERTRTRAEILAEDARRGRTAAAVRRGGGGPRRAARAWGIMALNTITGRAARTA